MKKEVGIKNILNLEISLDSFIYISKDDKFPIYTEYLEVNMDLMLNDDGISKRDLIYWIDRESLCRLEYYHHLAENFLIKKKLNHKEY